MEPDNANQPVAAAPQATPIPSLYSREQYVQSINDISNGGLDNQTKIVKLLEIQCRLLLDLRLPMDVPIWNGG